MVIIPSVCTCAHLTVRAEKERNEMITTGSQILLSLLLLLIYSNVKVTT